MAVLVARGPLHEALRGPGFPPRVHTVFLVSRSGQVSSVPQAVFPPCEPQCLGLGFTPPLPHAPIPAAPCAPLGQPPDRYGGFWGTLGFAGRMQVLHSATPP